MLYPGTSGTPRGKTGRGVLITRERLDTNEAIFTLRFTLTINSREEERKSWDREGKRERDYSKGEEDTRSG